MPNQLSIDSRRIVVNLLFIVALLLLASVAGQFVRFQFGYDSVKGLVQLFNVDNELNVPTFFSSLLALSSAALLFLTASAARSKGHPDTKYWFALAAGFLFLAYDETFQVHEGMIEPMRAMLGGGELGIFYFSWVVPGIAGVCVLALVFMRFFLRLPRRTRDSFLLAVGIYLSGCLGMELLDGAYFESYGNDFTYALLVTIEEGLEMCGLIMFVRTFLNHLAGDVRLIAFGQAESALPAFAMQAANARP
ncbi:hypothetical protein LQ564_03270 [Massilia sp. G4R7]|uniref:Multidrug transporter n=1 Tax=Massilia phyllostachyos TaxID=2898585 RepID=A0ABS8Q3W0_9BURK|nr:hypothetical protein [Massilia phyllostachyos]MCD2515330.1 hypothetical protein [Massilia phyllostachyos]